MPTWAPRFSLTIATNLDKRDASDCVQKQSEPAPTPLVSVRPSVERTRFTDYFLSLLLCSVVDCSTGFVLCFDSDLGCPPFAMIALLLNLDLGFGFPQWEFPKLGKFRHTLTVR